MPWPVFQWAGSPSAYAFNRAKVRTESGKPQGWLAAKYGIQSVPAAVLLDAVRTLVSIPRPPGYIALPASHRLLC